MHPDTNVRQDRSDEAICIGQRSRRATILARIATWVERRGQRQVTGATLDPLRTSRSEPAPAAPSDDSPASTFEPMRVCQVELSRDLPAIERFDDDVHDRAYGRAMVLVRLHGQPLGAIVVRLGDAGVSGTDLAARIDAELGSRIEAHLLADDLGIGGGQAAADPPEGHDPSCVTARRRAGARRSASIVITTRDRTAQLEAALRSVFALDHASFDVVVVDNVPSDDSTETMIRSRFAGNVALTYVREDRPGISAARNTGVRLARGEVIAFTDDDVEVDPGWLSALVAGFDTTPGVGVVTGLTLPAAIDLPVHELFEEYGGFDKGFSPRVVDLGPLRPPDDPLFPYAPGRLGSGNNMAFQTDALRAIGGFDECLGVGSPTHSGEDLAAFIRVLWSGRKLAYEPGALIFHHHRDTYAALRRQVYGYGVGLSACLISCLSRNPRALADVASRVPVGLKYLLSPSSGKNRRRSADYPRSLALAEAAGIAYGPFAYGRARADARRWRAGRVRGRSGIGGA